MKPKDWQRGLRMRKQGDDSFEETHDNNEMKEDYSIWDKGNMNYIIKRILVLWSLCSFFSSAFSQSLEVIPSSGQLISKVDSIVIEKMIQYNIPGLSIGVVSDGSILYSNGYGVRNINSDKRVDENTIFHTASISKIFTALAIMNLVYTNDLSLDDRVVDILSDLNYDNKSVKKISIRNLLNHTSGIKDVKNYKWSKNNQADDSLEKYLLGRKVKLEFEPSSKYKYCNLGYDILGFIIQEIAQISFEDYVKENILNTSGMATSDFRHFEISEALRVEPHSKRRLSGKVYKRNTYPYTREHAPSSTLKSSAMDLSVWMSSFLQSISQYVDMISPSFEAYPYIGLGFQLSQINGFKTIGHYGGDKGFRSYLLIIPERKIGLVVLANADFNEDFRQEILHPIAKWLIN